MEDYYFDKWYWHILKHEAALFPSSSDKEWYRKGIVNDPDDRGGLTNKGLTYKTYLTVGKRIGIKTSKNHFLNISREDHKKFIRYFWNMGRPDLIKEYKIQNNKKEFAPIDYEITAFIAEEIWAGGRGAIKYHQRKFNQFCGAKLTVDGWVGNQTLYFLVNFLGKNITWTSLILFKELRYEYIISKRPINNKFRRGWERRRRDFIKLYPQFPFYLPE